MGKKSGLRPCWVDGSSWRWGGLRTKRTSHSWDVGSLGLKPDRAVEGAADLQKDMVVMLLSLLEGKMPSGWAKWGVPRCRRAQEWPPRPRRV